MYALQLPSRKLEVELTTLSSNYHVELNPSDVGNNDRYVVQEIIKVGPAFSGTGAGGWGWRVASTALAGLASPALPPWSSTPTQCLLQHEQGPDIRALAVGTLNKLTTAVRRNTLGIFELAGRLWKPNALKRCLTVGAWRMQEMARSRPVELKGARSFKSLVLHETDRLSKEAQHSLRRTMEKYTAACRLVLICNNVSKVGVSTHPHALRSVGAERTTVQVQSSCVFMCGLACELAVVVSREPRTRQGCLLLCAHGPPEWDQRMRTA